MDIHALQEIEKIKERYGPNNLIEMVHLFLSHEKQQQQVERFKAGRIGKFYPSSVGDCKRKIAYQMMGYPGKLLNGQNLLITENGTSFHDRMETIFGRMGILLCPELSLSDKDLRISGRTDAVIWNFLREPEEEDGESITLYKPKKIEGKTVYENGDPVMELIYEGPHNHILLVEFKSIKSKNFHEHIPKTKPKKEHEMQLQLYFYLTGIRKGLVYYENKDNQEQKYFIVEYNQEIITGIIEDIRFIISCIDKKELPEREFQPTDVKCRYCDFRDICWPNFNALDYTKII